MVDVGCGIGGSSRHIAQKFGCTAEGITLSPVQVPPRHLHAMVDLLVMGMIPQACFLFPCDSFSGNHCVLLFDLGTVADYMLLACGDLISTVVSLFMHLCLNNKICNLVV